MIGKENIILQDVKTENGITYLGVCITRNGGSDEDIEIDELNIRRLQDLRND